MTVAEANEYIETIYPDTVNEFWSMKTEEQKESMLEVACIELDCLPFTGEARHASQSLMFPRWPFDQVPAAVKYAQIEIAAAPLNPKMQQHLAEMEKRSQLQRQGVTAFSIDDLSETYGGVNQELIDHPILANAKVEGLLRRYLQGGYAVC